MSSKHDKNQSIQMTRKEEEEEYTTREFEYTPPSRNYSTTNYSQAVSVPSSSSRQIQAHYDSHSSDDDNFEEWTTTKKKVNHKTRQVETRVSRQLLVEDGKVIADSGPQVVTRIKEDNRVEESEKEKSPKNKSKFEAISNAPEGECSGRVLGEKKEVLKKSRQVREENMQYHDERFKELTGHDVHRRALKAPQDFITITDKDSSSAPRGKMVHYSNKGKTYRDTDEILEVAKLAIDGSITKEVKRTKHHEEESEDEQPDETGEAETLRYKPSVTRSSRKHVDYVNDFNDTAPPDYSSSDEIEGDPRAFKSKSHPQQQHQQRHHHSPSRSEKKYSQSRNKSEEAFPRYGIDSYVGSFNADDRSNRQTSTRTSSGRYVEHPLVRKNQSSSSSDEETLRKAHHHHNRSQSPHSGRGSALEHHSRRSMKETSHSPSSGHNRERSFSPTNKSHLSHRSNKSHRSHKEDASVQAHLTDEEEEKRSSSSGLNSHEKKTRHLQRQSNANSSRNYYFGESRHQKTRPASEHSSSSSSSLSDPKERMRKDGARSKDSGFRSPTSHHRTVTPISANQQEHIYSTSGKSKRKEQRSGAASPTSTIGSGGHRNVKTTTTTLAAGLTDRPGSRVGEYTNRADNVAKKRNEKKAREQNMGRKHGDEDETQSLDTISLSSLGQNARTIKVPYRHSTEHQVIKPKEHKQVEATINSRKMSLEEDIENLNKRLETIKRIPIEQHGKKDRKEDQLEHFDYKTVIATVHSAPPVPRQNIVDTYNVRVIQHRSPFLDTSQQPVKSISELSSSIARLELLSSKIESNYMREANQSKDNNNEAEFDLNDYVKHKAMPAFVDSGIGHSSSQFEDDRLSIFSTSSMRSSRTYDIRAPDEELQVDGSQVILPEDDNKKDSSGQPEEEENDEKRPAAWVFDLRDGSSTAIKAPPKPKRPESPKIDSKTEELAESRGGRSYYLELIEKEKKVEPRQRPSSIDSLYSRWNSHSTLNTARPFQPPQRQSTPTKPNLKQDQTRKSRQILPASIIDNSSNKPIFSSSKNITNEDSRKNNQVQKRRQLPFSGPPLGNRSKSSSCLLTSTRPSKYSIYGGLKRANEDNKPVPRLSYSRAIGPKSQRQINAQPKTPSRYLKMR